MKKLLSLLLLMSLVFMLFSCSSGRNVKFRAHKMYESIDYTYHTYDYVDIIETDSAFKAGDTVYLNRFEKNGRYLLIERVK